MKPNYIVIGAAKCGTTSLCYHLGRHPEVFMADPKEPHYFGYEHDPQKTVRWYESLFDNSVGEIAIGEGSTSYTHPDIIRQAAYSIFKYIPDCSLIYMVRHPLRRLESDWKMRRNENWAPVSFNEAVNNQRTLTTHGMYWKNLSEYRRLFRDEQLLIVFLEDFRHNPNKELKRCFKHINVNPSIVIDDADKPLNQSRNFHRDGIFARYLRRTRYFDSIKNAMPSWLRYGAKTMFTRKEDLTVQWDEEIRRSVIEELREDSFEFLRYCNKPTEFWDL